MNSHLNIPKNILKKVPIIKTKYMLVVFLH